MEVARGEVWWADLAASGDSSPGGSRPVLVVQTKSFNQSRIQTVIVAILTTNLGLARAPGNVEIGSGESGLPRASVVNVSQLYTLDRRVLRDRAGRLRPATMKQVDQGLMLALAL